jgi:hypothetical protein
MTEWHRLVPGQADAKAAAVGAARAENAQLELTFLQQPAEVRRSLVSQQGLLDDLRAS